MQQINESEMEKGGNHLQQVLRYIERYGLILQFDALGGAEID